MVRLNLLVCKALERLVEGSVPALEHSIGESVRRTRLSRQQRGSGFARIDIPDVPCLVDSSAIGGGLGELDSAVVTHCVNRKRSGELVAV